MADDSIIETKHRINSDVPIILDTRDNDSSGGDSDDTQLLWSYYPTFSTYLSKEKQDTRRPLVLNTRVPIDVEITPGYTIKNLESGEPVHGPKDIDFGGVITLELRGIGSYGKYARIKYRVVKQIRVWENSAYHPCQIDDLGFTTQEKRISIIQYPDEQVVDESIGFYDGSHQDVEIYHYIKNGGVYYSFGEEGNGVLRVYYNDDDYATGEIYLKVEVFGSIYYRGDWINTGAYAKVSYFEAYMDYLMNGPIPEEEKKNRSNFFLFWNDRDFLKIR